MRLKFDKGLQYQFSLFFADNGADASELRNLPSLISKQTPQSKSLGLKLAKREGPATVMLAGRPGQPLPYFEWSAGSGIWKLIWTPIRLDLTFDALGFSEIIAGNSDEPPDPPTLESVVERVAINLADSVKASSRPVIRMALIVTAIASEQLAPRPSATVAAKFFSEQIQQNVLNEEILDLNARVNTVTRLDLPVANQGKLSVRINQLESGSSNWLLEDGKESLSLNWQLDVNTHPLDVTEKRAFDKDAVLSFFDFAKTWISERLAAVGALNDRNQ